jgi:hypothetical protein
LGLSADVFYPTHTTAGLHTVAARARAVAGHLLHDRAVRLQDDNLLLAIPQQFGRFSRHKKMIPRQLAATMLLVAVAVVTCSVASARSCTDDTLQSKSDDGDVLIMLSGAIYKVMPGDEADAALWLPPADVLVCNTTVSRQGRTFVFYEIINTDDGGEKVEAERLR